jgi:hypothetical protein
LKSRNFLLKILGNFAFGEIWPTCSSLHLVARKNKFPAKADQNFEFPLKVGFGLIYLYFEIET